MRAYLIDPAARTVTEIDHDEIHLKALLGTEDFKIDQLSGKDSIYVPRYASDPRFHVKGYMTSFFGRGLVTSHTIDGEMCEPRITLRSLKKMVSFP